jgi:hypothetical protein
MVGRLAGSERRDTRGGGRSAQRRNKVMQWNGSRRYVACLGSSVSWGGGEICVYNTGRPTDKLEFVVIDKCASILRIGFPKHYPKL